MLGLSKTALTCPLSFILPETCNMAAAMETEQLGLEIFETVAGCEEHVEKEESPRLEPFYVERYSWSQLKKLLTDTRKYHGYMMAKAPHDFMFVKKNDPEGPHSHRIYYLGKLASGTHASINLSAAGTYKLLAVCLKGDSTCCYSGNGLCVHSCPIVD